MIYTEKQLQQWTNPLSPTEEQRAENSIKMIRSAISSNYELNKMNIEVFTQGSYANNTNVRSESDVDVCVMLRDVFHCDYPAGGNDELYGFKSSDFSFSEYRDLIKKALVAKFGLSSIREGNKSIKIRENTYNPTIGLTVIRKN